MEGRRKRVLIDGRFIWPIIGDELGVDTKPLRCNSPEFTLQKIAHILQQAYGENPPLNFQEEIFKPPCHSATILNRDKLTSYCKNLRVVIDDAVSKGLTTREDLFKSHDQSQTIGQGESSRGLG